MHLSLRLVHSETPVRLLCAVCTVCRRPSASGRYRFSPDITCTLGGLHGTQAYERNIICEISSLGMQLLPTEHPLYQRTSAHKFLDSLRFYHLRSGTSQGHVSPSIAHFFTKSHHIRSPIVECLCGTATSRGVDKVDLRSIMTRSGHAKKLSAPVWRQLFPSTSSSSTCYGAKTSLQPIVASVNARRERSQCHELLRMTFPNLPLQTPP